MPTTGQFIRARLIEAGGKGVVIADLHKERKANWRELGLVYKTGTYHSLSRLFYFLQQLGWVEATGETEEAFAKGTTSILLAPRTYYRITDDGLTHPEEDWMDPLSAKYPELTGSERASKYRLPTGKPRGRPRLAPPVVKKLPKPPKVRKPKVTKPLKITLTQEEKDRLVDEGISTLRDIAKRTGRRYRAPTQEEIYEWFSEELKIKTRIVKEFVAEHGREPTKEEYEEVRWRE